MGASLVWGLGVGGRGAITCHTLQVEIEKGSKEQWVTNEIRENLSKNHQSQYFGV